MVNGFRKRFGMGLQARAAALATAALVTASACTVKDTTSPPLSGPSESALSLVVTANPDAISQDGTSQSSIQVFARDANAKPVSGLALRMDMIVNGVPEDLGRLSPRTIVTSTDGKATTVYTAPGAQPTNSVSASCAGTIFSPSVPGACVNITATPVSTNFATVTSAFVTLRLVPVGVILPPASTPTAQIRVSPTPVKAGISVLLDGSGSCSGPIVNGACTGTNAITDYQWDFGDGGTSSGKMVSHAFTAAASYNVTLTVTNDRGLAASTTTLVDVEAPVAPVAIIVVSPTGSVAAGQPVFFNAATSTAAAGRAIVSYSWDFGDGSPVQTGVTASHSYPLAGSYVVVLTVKDDLGQPGTTTATVEVK